MDSETVLCAKTIRGNSQFKAGFRFTLESGRLKRIYIYIKKTRVRKKKSSLGGSGFITRGKLMSLCIILQSNFEGAGGKRRGGFSSLIPPEGRESLIEEGDEKPPPPQKKRSFSQEILHRKVSECHSLLEGREEEGEEEQERERATPVLEAP